MKFIDYLLGAGETGAPLTTSGDFISLYIVGLTAGTVKLQVRFQKSEIEDPTTWRDFPEGNFSSDVAKTIDIPNDDAVSFRVVGVGNNAGIYVRVSEGAENGTS